MYIFPSTFSMIDSNIFEEVIRKKKDKLWETGI